MVSFCLHLGINHSLHRQQTSTPFSPLTASTCRSEVVLFSSPFFPHPSTLSHSGLIYSSFQSSPFHLPSVLPSPFPLRAPIFSHRLPFFSLRPPTYFSFLCRSPKQSFPIPQSVSFLPPPLSRRPSSQVVSLIWSKHLSKPSPLLPSICFTSSSAPTLITHHRHISFPTFCLSVSIGERGEQPALS